MEKVHLTEQGLTQAAMKAGNGLLNTYHMEDYCKQHSNHQTGCGSWEHDVNYKHDGNANSLCKVFSIN